MSKKTTSLENYPLEYEEVKTGPLASPKTKPKQKKVKSPLVRKVAEMANEAKQKKYATSRIEVAKTVTIAVLVTAVIAFIAGMQFKQSQQAEVQAAVHTATAQIQASK